MKEMRRMKKRGLIAGICLLALGSASVFASGSVFPYSFYLNGGEAMITSQQIIKHNLGFVSSVKHTYTSNAGASTKYNVCLQNNVATTLTKYVTAPNGVYNRPYYMEYTDDRIGVYVKLKGIPANSSAGSYTISGLWDLYE